MNKKALVVSTLAAILIILASLSSVVGTNAIKSNDEKRSISSPLFAVRTQRSLDGEETKKVNANYIGKGKALNLLFLRKSPLQSYVDRALKIIDNRPNILRSVANRIAKIPEIATLLKENGMTINEFKSQMNQFINDPILMKEKVDEAALVSPFGDDPLPLGLSTSSALGCFIVALILAPIFAMIGLIIATITILTCLNINNCFENIVSQLIENFIQGLTPPDYI
ncbi:MAG: hypothetical protein JSW06_00345 [Thermoplasmatales archaeon]|nr:MAG: hypothetical protein JSW06_00345 [Thermoplasmatales archaeon]